MEWNELKATLTKIFRVSIYIVLFYNYATTAIACLHFKNLLYYSQNCSFANSMLSYNTDSYISISAKSISKSSYIPAFTLSEKEYSSTVSCSKL